MRLSLWAALLFVGLGHGSLLGQGVLPGDRWPVRSTPLICGREIPRFVIFERTRVKGPDEKHASLRVSAGNLFIPVSQDKNGVFYHALIGIVEYDFHYGDLVVPGGIYVSKTVPNRIFIYFGDARKPGWVLRPVAEPLPQKVLEKLRIGHVAGSAPAQTSKRQGGR